MAYEVRISDWSSDVCSSDLHLHQRVQRRSHYGSLGAKIRPVAGSECVVLQAMAVLKQQQTGFINGFGQDMGWRIAWVVLWKSDKKRIFEKHFAVHIPTGTGKGETEAIEDRKGVV